MLIEDRVSGFSVSAASYAEPLLVGEFGVVADSHGVADVKILGSIGQGAEPFVLTSVCGFTRSAGEMVMCAKRVSLFERVDAPAQGVAMDVVIEGDVIRWYVIGRDQEPLSAGMTGTITMRTT